MSRIMGFILALVLTLGGVGWLVFQLFIAEEFSRNLVVAAVIVLVMGAHWVWTDYFPVLGREGTNELDCSLFRSTTERGFPHSTLHDKGRRVASSLRFDAPRLPGAVHPRAGH